MYNKNGAYFMSKRKTYTGEIKQIVIEDIKKLAIPILKSLDKIILEQPSRFLSLRNISRPNIISGTL